MTELMRTEVWVDPAHTKRMCDFGRNSPNGGSLKLAEYRVNMHDRASGQTFVRLCCKPHANSLLADMALPPTSPA